MHSRTATSERGPSLARRRRRPAAESLADRVAGAFLSAPFPLYGLPPGDPGWRRRLGPVPSSWPAEAAELVHERFPTGCEVRVETSIRRCCGDWRSQLAATFAWWSRRPPPGAHLSFRDVRLLNRRTEELVAALAREPRHETSLDVDGRELRFTVLEDEGNWAAHGRLAGVLLTVFAREVDVDEVALARAVDLTPYIAGERRPAWETHPVRLVRSR